MDVQPYGVHAAYGMTDELMVAMGSGIVYHDGGDSDFFPYFTSKFRVLDNEQASVTLGSYVGLFVSEENVVHYGASRAISRSVESLAVHLAAGLFGSAVDGVTANSGGSGSRMEATWSVGAYGSWEPPWAARRAWPTGWRMRWRFGPSSAWRTGSDIFPRWRPETTFPGVCPPLRRPNGGQ